MGEFQNIWCRLLGQYDYNSISIPKQILTIFGIEVPY
jgi:hypothetical protein